MYYKPKGESDQNLQIMNLIDRLWTDRPFRGSRTITTILKLDYNIEINRKRVQRLMRLMGIESICPQKNLSKRTNAEYKRPYLLRNLEINRPNQVWQTDITYIQMRHGFMYLAASIDVYSRFITGWSISNTLSADWVHQMLRDAFKAHGKPEIINSDQGIQFTCGDYIKMLEDEGVKISMDGKGRALDNIYIERFWRTVKYEYVYLNPADNGLSLYAGIDGFMKEYNYIRRHSEIKNQRPSDIYINPKCEVINRNQHQLTSYQLPQTPWFKTNNNTNIVLV
jgi:putative transposase